MSYERLSQLHTNSACGSVVGLCSARQLHFPAHASSCSTPLRAALSFSFRRSAAELVICRESDSSIESFAARCGSGRWLRVTNLQQRAFCLSTHLRSMLSLGLRPEFNVQTCGAGPLNVPPIAAMRGSPRFLRASNGSLRRAARSSTRFSARCFCGRAFYGSTRSLPRNTNAEVKANNGAAANRRGCHGSCYSGSVLSRAVVALSYVRCLSLRSTLAATAPAAPVAELESLAVFTPALRP